MSHRIFVVDDHPIMRRGYTSLINREPDLEVCGDAGSAEEALCEIPDAAPDLVIADISMTGMNGIELVKHLRARQPRLPVLVVSMHDEGLYAERALHAGARGYIMKNEVDTAVVEAIHRLLQGKVYVSEKMGTKLLLQYAGRQRGDVSPVQQLSDRELEVFELIGRGYSTRQIADMLHISNKTVESHRGRIKRKLKASTSTELLQRAVRWAQREALV